MNEGSVVNQASSAPNEPTWTNVSTGSYNSRIVNGRTGSRRLALPLSTLGAEPIDLIRRPPLTEPPTSQLFAERHFSQASMRILLSDTQADLLGLPTATGTPPVPLDGSPIPGYTVGPTNPPLGLTRDGMTIGSVGYNEGYRMPDLTPVLGGFLKIEIRNALGLWTDVTAEILNLGIAGGSVDPACAGVNPNPNAVLRLQRIRDDTIAPGVMNVNPFHQPCGLNAAFEVGQDPNDYWPNVLYDSREGAYRDIWSQSWQLGVLGGTMHYVELDVNNLRRYLEGTIGATGLTVAQINSDGYLVYFSDRRGNRDALGQETGEFGFEDIVNWGFTGWPNAVKDPGEDINDNGTLDLYGQTPRFPPAVASGQVPLLQSARPWTWVGAMVGTPYVTRANPAIFFRRALKLTNGTLGNLPMPGLTVTSENPVYIQGDYNAAGGFGDPHAAAAVIADGVTMLVEQLERPQRDQLANNPNQRNATDTWYRAAIGTGTTLNFPRPWGTPATFGTDGGVPNLLRFLESWSGDDIWFRGSLAILFTSRQGNGTFKCCNNVYRAPTRNFEHDTDFLNLDLLPPATPYLTDVNITGFTHVIRPTS